MARKKFKFSKKSRANMVKVNSIMVRLAELTIERTTVDFGILDNGGYRTAEMQRELFLKRHSQLDGFSKISSHQLGNALDFVPYIDGEYTWDDKDAFKAINEAVMSAWKEMNLHGVQLVWGGNWKFYDPAHYNIKNK